MSPTMHDLVSCLTDYHPDALSVAQARQLIAQLIQPIHHVEKLALRSALGRVLAENIVAPLNVPAQDNSAMDGYAFHSSNLQAGQATQLRIVTSILAGQGHSTTIRHGECARIMTGAVVPPDCDTVVPQELVSLTDDSISIPPDQLRAGANRRLAGEDLRQGTVALHQGKLLRPADLGLLASLGIAEVAVQRRLRVAFFSTGDELRSLGEALDPGCVYDSNRYTLYGMLTRLGCEIIDMGVIRDHPAALEAAFRSACENADAIITSGGVSVGAADYTKQIMHALGDVAFWNIAMRPGRPMAVGQIRSDGHSAYVFGLPGNPVAVMVSFYVFVRVALLQLMAAQFSDLILIPAHSCTAIPKRAGRTEYQRGIFSRNAQGQLQVQITGHQGSGVLRSMSEANCILVLHHEQENIAEGEIVDVLPFEALL